MKSEDRAARVMANSRPFGDAFGAKAPALFFRLELADVYSTVARQALKFVRQFDGKNSAGALASSKSVSERSGVERAITLASAFLIFS